MSRLLRLLIVEEIVAGLRERGLPVNSLDDLTGREIELIRQYAWTPGWRSLATMPLRGF
jgi:hypothetical protein